MKYKETSMILVFMFVLSLGLLFTPLIRAADVVDGDQGYNEVRQIISDGQVLLKLEPDELFVFTTNQKVYEKSLNAREKLLGQYIKEKFPDLKYKLVHWDDHGIRESNFEESGVYPDLILDLVDRNTTRIIKSYGMQYDLTPLIEKYSFDLDRIDQASMNLVYDRSTGDILSIPFEVNDYILYYNKNIFDLKNEPYPTFGMTYDQAYEKAQKLTFGEGFTMYKGYLQHPDQYLKCNQLGLIPFSLTEPDKIVLDTPEWNYIVDNLMRFYEIRGNIWNSTDDFFAQGTAAMCVDHLERLSQIALIDEYLPSSEKRIWQERFEENGLIKGNWDIAPIPVLEEGDTTIYRPNLLGWFIPKQSKMKDTAFQLIMHLLSDEVQLERAKDGVKGVVKTPEIAQAFGANIPELQGINLDAVYWGENAVQPVRTPEVAGGGYWDIALWMVFRQYILKDGYMPEIALKRVEQEQNEWILDRIAEGRQW